MKPENTVFQNVLREPLLKSVVKYDKFATLIYVDSKKQLFTAAAHGGSADPLLHPALIGGENG